MTFLTALAGVGILVLTVVCMLLIPRLSMTIVVIDLCYQSDFVCFYSASFAQIMFVTMMVIIALFAAYFDVLTLICIGEKRKWLQRK